MSREYQISNISLYRGFSNLNKQNNKKEKFNFKEKKENISRSLTEVELFLNNIKDITKYLKLYKLLK